MRINTTQTDKLTIRDTEVENVEQFTYIGSIISTTWGTDEDIKARKRKAQQAFASSEKYHLENKHQTKALQF